jgi:hypothetical protein
MLQWSVLSVKFCVCCFLVSVTMWFHIKVHIQSGLKIVSKHLTAKSMVKRIHTHVLSYFMLKCPNHMYSGSSVYCVVLIRFPLADMLLLRGHLTFG